MEVSTQMFGDTTREGKFLSTIFKVTLDTVVDEGPPETARTVSIIDDRVESEDNDVEPTLPEVDPEVVRSMKYLFPFVYKIDDYIKRYVFVMTSVLTHTEVKRALTDIIKLAQGVETLQEVLPSTAVQFRPDVETFGMLMSRLEKEIDGVMKTDIPRLTNLARNKITEFRYISDYDKRFVILAAAAKYIKQLETLFTTVEPELKQPILNEIAKVSSSLWDIIPIDFEKQNSVILARKEKFKQEKEAREKLEREKLKQEHEAREKRRTDTAALILGNFPKPINKPINKRSMGIPTIQSQFKSFKQTKIDAVLSSRIKTIEKQLEKFKLTNLYEKLKRLYRFLLLRHEKDTKAALKIKKKEAMARIAKLHRNSDFRFMVNEFRFAVEEARRRAVRVENVSSVIRALTKREFAELRASVAEMRAEKVREEQERAVKEEEARKEKEREEEDVFLPAEEEDVIEEEIKEMEDVRQEDAEEMEEVDDAYFAGMVVADESGMVVEDEERVLSGQEMFNLAIQEIFQSEKDWRAMVEHGNSEEAVQIRAEVAKAVRDFDVQILLSRIHSRRLEERDEKITFVQNKRKRRTVRFYDEQVEIFRNPNNPKFEISEDIGEDELEDLLENYYVIKKNI
jgi:hypothetical protein